MAYGSTHLKALAFLDKVQVPAENVDRFLTAHSRDSLEACTPDEVKSITQSLTGVLWENIPNWGSGGWRRNPDGSA